MKKIFPVIGYILYLLVFTAIFDIFILKKMLNMGWPRELFAEETVRMPTPYTMFAGKPNVLDHNNLGFRGKLLSSAKKKDLTIAFFGGSTGYRGNPTIAEIIEKTLNDSLGIGVTASNFSVVSSHHRQHLHGMVEYFADKKPDIVIFYGGYNELLQNGFYDPRPGYPFNYFYRNETSAINKVLIENSAICGLLDRKFGLFSGLRKLQEKYQPFSEKWNKEIIENYFNTLSLSHSFSKSMKSEFFENTQFLAFYQPYQIPKNFLEAHLNIKNKIKEFNFVFDVSDTFEGLGKDIYEDIVHVNQEGSDLMGKRIANIVKEQIKNTWHQEYAIK